MCLLIIFLACLSPLFTGKKKSISSQEEFLSCLSLSNFISHRETPYTILANLAEGYIHIWICKKEKRVLAWVNHTIESWSWWNRIETNLGTRGTEAFYMFTHHILQMYIVSLKGWTKSFFYRLILKNTELLHFPQCELRLLLFCETWITNSWQLWKSWLSWLS